MTHRVTTCGAGCGKPPRNHNALLCAECLVERKRKRDRIRAPIYEQTEQCKARRKHRRELRREILAERLRAWRRNNPEKYKLQKQRQVIANKHRRIEARAIAAQAFEGDINPLEYRYG